MAPHPIPAMKMETQVREFSSVGVRQSRWETLPASRGEGAKCCYEDGDASPRIFVRGGAAKPLGDSPRFAGRGGKMLDLSLPTRLMPMTSSRSCWPRSQVAAT